MQCSDIEEIVITAPLCTGAWRGRERFCPADWTAQVLTSKKTHLGLHTARRRWAGKVLNQSTEGIAYKLYKRAEVVPGERVLIQLDRCEKGLDPAHYTAVAEVVRVCEDATICARFVAAPWDLIDAIESGLQEAG